MKKYLMLAFVAGLAISAFAEMTTVNGVDWYYYVNGNNTATITLNGSQYIKYSGDLVVPSELDGHQVTRISSYAFADCNNLTSIVIPEGVTEIGDRAFVDCRSLISVKLPSSVRSIYSYAFYNCYNLKSINIPSGITVIECYTFGYCRSLENITLPEGLERIEGQAFYDCNSLSKLVIPASVTQIDSGNRSSNRLTIFKGEAPAGDWRYQISGQIIYPKAYAASYASFVSAANFGGYTETLGSSSVEIVSAQMREGDPTIMDIVYRVNSDKTMVKVRAIAFEGQERSFKTLVLPKSFIEGTGANLGDYVSANQNHTLSWKVTDDYNKELTNLKVEILVLEGELLPMELVDIPAADGYSAMTVAKVVPSNDMLEKAIYWLWASNDSNMRTQIGQVSAADPYYYWGDGDPGTRDALQLYYKDICLGEENWHGDDAEEGRHFGFMLRFANLRKAIYDAMGYELLQDQSIINHINNMTDLGISSGCAYKLR